MEWYVDMLGAEVTFEQIVMDDGRTGTVELVAGGMRWMMTDPFPDLGVEDSPHGWLQCSGTSSATSGWSTSRHGG
jgi:hypothetical protein